MPSPSIVHNDESTLEDDFASWIPHWDLHLYSSYTGTLNNYNRFSRRIISRLSSPKITVSPNQTALKVRAIVIDTIKFTSPSFNRNSTTPKDVVSLSASPYRQVRHHGFTLALPCELSLRYFVAEFTGDDLKSGRHWSWLICDSCNMSYSEETPCIAAPNIFTK